MGIFGRPANYSEMLTRIFSFTLFVGIGCTLTLMWVCPDLEQMLSTKPIEWDMAGVKLPILAAFIPLVVAIFSLMCKLHDRVSDVLKIRLRFDVNYILCVYASKLGFDVTKEIRGRLKTDRDYLMGKVFYKYVPNATKAVINPELVIAALDLWSWLWCMVEASVVVVVAGLVALPFAGWVVCVRYLLVAVVLALLAYCFWSPCKRAAARQMDSILEDSNRKDSIKEEFYALQNPKI